MSSDLDKWTIKFRVDCSEFDLREATAMLSEFAEVYDTSTFDRLVSESIKVQVVDPKSGTFKLWFDLEELSRRYYDMLEGGGGND